MNEFKHFESFDHKTGCWNVKNYWTETKIRHFKSGVEFTVVEFNEYTSGKTRSIFQSFTIPTERVQELIKFLQN